MKKIRQIEGRIWFGRAKVTFSRIGSYMGYANFLMLILTFYTVKGHEYASLETFIVAAIIGIIIIGAFDYLIMLPCEIAFGNEQWAKHQNPVYDEIKLVRKEIKEMKEKLNEKKQSQN